MKLGVGENRFGGAGELTSPFLGWSPAEDIVPKTDWKDTDGTVTTVSEQQGRGGPIYEIAFNYKVGEHWYGGSYTTNEAYAAGDSIAVRYDPKDPNRNDLSAKETRARWILVGVAIAVVLLVVAIMLLTH
jgi:hypothetical protein